MVKVRVQVMVEKEVSEIFKEYAIKEGSSVSEVSAEILRSAVPVLVQTMRVLDASRSLNAAAKNSLAQGLAAVADNLETRMNETMTEFADVSDIPRQ